MATMKQREKGKRLNESEDFLYRLHLQYTLQPHITGWEIKEKITIQAETTTNKKLFIARFMA